MVVVVGGLGFAAIAWWQVPWQPVPGGTPPPVAVNDVLSPPQVARAEEFSKWARCWGYGSLAVSLAVASWLGFTRAGARLMARMSGPWWVQVVLGVAGCALVGWFATLPFGLALHRLRVDEGLSTQSVSGWLGDTLLSLLVTVIATALALVLVIGTARRWRRAWPAAAGGTLGALVMLGSFVYPVLVEPLFYDFAPLPDGALRSEILAVAHDEGVRVDEVLVADASRRTTTLNAYVSGYGATRQVVLYDTLVEDAPRDEAVAVVAHELAHARHDDVLVGSVLGALGAATGVGLLALVTGVSRRWGEGARMSDPAVVPRVLALLAIASLVASPVQSGISRHVETRADVEALAATGDPEAFVRLQQRLAVRSLADPTPPVWSQLWFGSHPTLLERLALAAGHR
jgi:STE24 endopeptidase